MFPLRQPYLHESFLSCADCGSGGVDMRVTECIA